MSAASSATGRMQRATLGSIAIHAMVALLIPALAWTAADNANVETVSFTHILRIRIVRPPAPLPHPRAVAPVYNSRPVINLTQRVTVVKLAHRSASHKSAIPTNAPAAPTVASAARPGVTNAQGGNDVPAADPTPAARNVSSIGNHENGGYLPFGAEQPVPVLDPAVRSRLTALGAHVTLIVTVGDDGRTTNVEFAPPIDPQLENKIRALLADANWDPAVCGGGVACEAQATIQL